MIISAMYVVSTRDIPKYAWSRIAQFQNIEQTTDRICQLHSIVANDNRQRANAKRQAEQIKYCLLQAREYIDAAASVSLATKPVLLYYSAMSMALAEVLLKQNGESRLAKLREKHNCHGLQLSLRANPKPDDSLLASAAMLVAKAQQDVTGAPRGSFEVWRRSAREYPAGGKHTTHFANGGSNVQYRLMLLPVDEPPPPLPATGVSLLDCITELHFMTDLLHRLGARSNLVRATIAGTKTLDQPERSALIVHPGPLDLIERFGSLIKIPAYAVNLIEFKELPAGYIMETSQDKPFALSYPPASCINDEFVHFSCSDLNLNEFGLLYIALHICGNFARYYPDIWLKHIEYNSPLSMAVDEICSHAFERLPLLMLSELIRTYHIVEK